jgi:hypothetical protein
VSCVSLYQVVYLFSNKKDIYVLVMWIKRLLFILMCLMASAALAERETNRGSGPQTLTPDAAAAAVQRATGGQVLGIQSNGSYRVKVLLQDGRVRVLRVDARSGQVLD